MSRELLNNLYAMFYENNILVCHSSYRLKLKNCQKHLNILMIRLTGKTISKNTLENVIT